jgi:SAM-dependent methyltransferase
MPPNQHYFANLFDGNDDPWSFKSRWYEERKRALTLAALPQRRYARAYEPGCANGELSAGLAERCDRLFCSDGTPRAVDLARQRLAGHAQVSVSEGWVPQDWPDGQFDLIVLSEIGYFLSAEALDQVAARTRASLAPGGTVLACHWRWPIEGCELSGDMVSARLAAGLQLPLITCIEDRDFKLDLWSGDGRSLAQVEGLV